MENKIKRPVPVWIAQILILILGVPFSLALSFSILGDAAFLIQSGPTFYLVFVLVVLFLVKIALIFLFLFAFWGLARRKGYGRWLAFALLSLLILLSIAGQFFRPAGPIEYYEYKNAAQIFGGILGGVVLYGLFGLLLYKLAFGGNVKAFFQSEGATPSAEAAVTPPS